MIYGYARVSTAKQKKFGTSLEEQTQLLLASGAQEIISDSYTGSKMDRPNFTALLARLNPGDKLIVTKLDRFARTAIQGAETVQELIGKGVVIHILNMGIADNSPMGKLMITILLAFAEFERDCIVERTQAGREIARANGILLDGRPPKFSRLQMQHALELLSDGNSYRHVSNLTGISVSTLVRAKRKANGEN